MHHYLRRGGRLALFLATLLALYTLLLLAAYSFPDEWIRENVTAATNVLIEEGNMPGGYATYFWHSGFGIADNVTDRVIYEGLLKNGRNVVDAAMRTDYARYWHGYAVLLRPMSIMLSIINIRYLNMMAVMGLLVLCCWHCRARLGARTALCFWVALAMGFVLLAPFCQQYMPVTLLTLLACCVLLGGWPRIRRFLPESFMLLGSVVCFLDFLTFPVLALGYPLICCLLLMLREGDPPPRLWKHALLLPALWLAGYSLTWLGKAVIGTLLTEQNVMADVLHQVAFRMDGSFDTGSYTITMTAAEALLPNLDTFFMGSNKALFLLLLLWTGFLALRRGRVCLKAAAKALPVLFVALFPFIWYLVLKNHVRLHFWMTYKQLSVTVFAVCAWLLAAAEVDDTAPRFPQTT